eukprot:gene13064-biopygen2663
MYVFRFAYDHHFAKSLDGSEAAEQATKAAKGRQAGRQGRQRPPSGPPGPPAATKRAARAARGRQGPPGPPAGPPEDLEALTTLLGEPWRALGEPGLTGEPGAHRHASGQSRRGEQPSVSHARVSSTVRASARASVRASVRLSVRPSHSDEQHCLCVRGVRVGTPPSQRA